MDDTGRRVGVPPPATGSSTAIERTVQRLVAVGYGLTYDGVVRGFPPYEALLDEIAAIVARAADGTRPLRVLDVSCGIGTVAARLARDGHLVVGVDAVAHLVDVAREKRSGIGGGNLAFHHVDVASTPVPGAGTFDAVVSMHTLYWHPNPLAVLAACRGALRPGGHAVILTYARAARVWQTFGELRAARGILPATRALRWLVPTAMFEMFRDCEHRYLSPDAFRTLLADAGFEVIEMRRTFLAGISMLAWARVPEAAMT